MYFGVGQRRAVPNYVCSFSSSLVSRKSTHYFKILLITYKALVDVEGRF